MTRMVTRTVTRPGLPPSVWVPTLHRAPGVRLPRRMRGERVLVVSAHADDETLGAGGLVQELHRRGAGFVTVVVTDGAAALPGLDPAGRRRLAAARRAEIGAALRELGLGDVPIHLLEVPDGRAGDHAGAIARRLGRIGSGCTWWLAPWRGDPHPDHAAVGAAAARSCPAASRLIEYPVWMRHGLLPGQVGQVVQSGHDLRVHRLDRGQRRRKRRAIACHASQIGIWDEAFEPVLPGHVLSAFRGSVEPLFVAAG